MIPELTSYQPIRVVSAISNVLKKPPLCHSPTTPLQPELPTCSSPRRHLNITMPPTHTPLTILLTLSGPSCSGKTTLARHLRSIFSVTSDNDTARGDRLSLSLSILHQDDYYLTDTEIPVITTCKHCPSGLGEREVQDWDCVGSLDVELMERVLRSVREGRGVPEGVGSKEDENEVGPSGVREGVIGEIRKGVQRWARGLEVGEVKVWLVEGFLLYVDPGSEDEGRKRLKGLGGLSDGRLWVNATRTEAIERRGRRKGYVTLEGYWADPEGYVEDVVWPGFVREHAWMEAGGNERVLEGGWETKEKVIVDEGVVGREGIMVGPQGSEMGQTVDWAVGIVKSVIEQSLQQRRND